MNKTIFHAYTQARKTSLSPLPKKRKNKAAWHYRLETTLQGWLVFWLLVAVGYLATAAA